MSSKCVHIVATHIPAEIVSFTKPLFEAYAKKICCDVNYINERKFPDFPPNYERMQVYETGKKYQWNFVIDANVLVGPLLSDFTKIVDQRGVGICLCTYAPHLFHTETNKYFLRDGRNLGVVEAMVVTSSLTHDLWKPLDGTPTTLIEQIKSGDQKLLSEYCLSLNTAMFRFEVFSPFAVPAQIHRLSTNSGTTVEKIAEGQQVLSSWGITL
jgi:hypothetical protein